MWLSVAINIIKLLTFLSTHFQSQGWMEQGRKEVREAELRQALASLALAHGILAEFKEKDDAAVDKTLEERGWYRDD